MSEHDLIPNFTQFPNKLMDYVIPILRESEEKVLIYVLRCTYGYRDQDGKQKEQDYISYSQFLTGQVSKEGKLINFGAGVSRSKLAEALAFHQATGLIERLDPAAGKRNAGRGATGLYRLNRHCEMVHFLNQCLLDPDTARERMVHFLNQKRLMVQKVNHSNKKANKDKPQAKNGSESEPLKNGSESEPEMVQKVNQQYKEKERETKDTPPISPSSALAGEVTNSNSPAGKFVDWWNREIVPLGGRSFSLEDADAKFITKANKALKSKSGATFWERVKQGFETSTWLRGEIHPRDGKRRFKATLPWLLSLHHAKGMANYVLVAAGEWTDDPAESYERKAISHDEVEL